MKRFLANWEIKLLAVAAAIIFWALVIGTENTFYTFPEEIAVKAFNLSDEFVVANDLGSVKLRLKIDNRDVIQNLSIEDFNVYIDLEGAEVGERDIEVEVSSKNADVNVLKAEPGVVKVQIEQRYEKEVKLDYKLSGQVKEGYEVKEVKINTETVMIKGAQDFLEGIEKAVLFIELNDESENVNGKYTVGVVDNNGNIIEGITVSNEEIEAEVVIDLISGQKLVGVQPNIVGAPSENRFISSINVEPSYIVLSGDMEIINDLSSIQTQPIDVSGISDNKEFQVGLINLPIGVLVEGESTVTVSVIVLENEVTSSNLKRKTVSVPLEIHKFQGDQADKKINPPTVALVVEGEQPDLNKIDERSLKIELDISGYSGQSATIQLDSSDIKLPSGVKFVNLEPNQIEVTWESK